MLLASLVSQKELSRNFLAVFLFHIILLKPATKRMQNRPDMHSSHVAVCLLDVIRLRVRFV
jgi:hypothetical protein